MKKIKNRIRKTETKMQKSCCCGKKEKGQIRQKKDKEWVEGVCGVD